ncbi:MAG: alpha-amylase family glycosyl hydrolase [Fidelibacterota bacterium]
MFSLLMGIPLEGSHGQNAASWWNHTVFYEIFVRSFYDSDGDGVGDVQGLIHKLDYLNDGDPATTSDLGVTGIWLMPVSPSLSYHGYDIIEYRDIEEDYGTLDDFSSFMDSAHARGIKVIVDLVLNHTSDQNPWFEESASSQESPFRDWYVWVQEDPGYTGPWGQQVWHERNGAYYFGLFWGGMPDLNYRNRDVKSEMFDVVQFWLDTMNVDGFRLDAIKHLFENDEVMENAPETLDFLEDFRQFYKKINPEAVTVGEVWSPTEIVALYSDGTKVDFCFEFNLAYAIIDAVNQGQPATILDRMKTVMESYPHLQYAPFLTNHDHDRVFGLLGEDRGRMKLAAAVYLTLPGVPFIYYGEEIGMTGSGRDENKRTPMQWTDGSNAGFTVGDPWYPVNSDYADANVEDMKRDENSLWNWYRTLITLRNENEALRVGDYVSLTSHVDALLAYARRSDDDMVILLHNFGDPIIAYPDLTLPESNLIPGEYTVTDLIAGNSLGTVTINSWGGFSEWRPSVELGSKGTVILRVEDSGVGVHPDDPPGGPFPGKVELAQNFPNPFNPATTFRFSLDEKTYVTLTIWDIHGRQIRTLVKGVQGPGSMMVAWDGTDDLGEPVSAGIYLTRMEAGSFSQTRKAVLIE